MRTLERLVGWWCHFLSRGTTEEPQGGKEEHGHRQMTKQKQFSSKFDALIEGKTVRGLEEFSTAQAVGHSS